MSAKTKLDKNEDKTNGQDKIEDDGDASELEQLSVIVPYYMSDG